MTIVLVHLSCQGLHAGVKALNVLSGIARINARAKAVLMEIGLPSRLTDRC